VDYFAVKPGKYVVCVVIRELQGRRITAQNAVVGRKK